MNNVKLYRKQIKMTRKVLAEKTGLSMSYIYFIESGERNPTIAVACKIADALGQSLDVLFTPNSISK
ncbi:MAG TPA: transcriptional regulator [Clostridiales bacterium]|nr:transcriptional regulator [Clostridiales bacterium]